MNRFLKRVTVSASLAPLIMVAAVSMGFAQDGTGGNRGTPTSRQKVWTPSGADGAILLGMTTVKGTNGTLMFPSSGSTINFPGLLANASGAATLPGFEFRWTGGGNPTGLNLPTGSFTKLVSGIETTVGYTGFTRVAGCEWVDSTGTLYGSAATTTNGPADALIHIDPLSGAGTQVGFYGAGIAGIDCLGWDPTTDILWGSTGFLYDGSPGDEIMISPITGAATDTGIDMLDTSGFGPSCSVTAMAFSDSGKGYIGTGCGGGAAHGAPGGGVPGSPAGGDVYEWTPGGLITFIGNNGQGSTNSLVVIL